MGGGTTSKIPAAYARAHTRKPKSNSPSTFAGMLKKVVLVFFVGFLAWAYQAARPPPPKRCGSKNGPPVTAPRIQLKDGRYMAYKEFGVPKDNAKHKIMYVHGFDNCRHGVSAITAQLSADIVESEGIYIVSFDRPGYGESDPNPAQTVRSISSDIYIVSFDRPGYGESDPNPAQTVRSISSDIEELADQLGLGSKFYVVGFSLGGQIVWTCLKSFLTGHISSMQMQLAGAALIAPAVNYWWKGLPSNLSVEAYKQQLPEDQWAFRVAHYVPWLSYWWNTQKLFPSLSLISHSPGVLSHQDAELIPRIHSVQQDTVAEVRQQGEFESLHRDLAFAFGRWEFDPTELRDPFAEGGGSVQLWQGDEDPIVPATLQRHIALLLPWIRYHEVAGAGHLFPFADGIADSIIQALVS